MYQRNGGSFYAKDRKTGQSFSLATSDEREASRLLVAKNQSTEQPCLNVAMAKVYLSAQSPEFLTRTWGDLIELVARGYEGATAIRWKKFAISAPLKLLVNLPLYQTESVHFLAVLNHKKAGVSTNVWLRILHNRALDMGWQLSPVLNKRVWPKVKYKARRAITAEEHAKIIESERMEDYAQFFCLLWETGGSQTDIAHLKAEDIDWGNSRLYYSRRKLAHRGGGRAALAMGDGLKAVLRELPASGPLFPRLRLLSEDERASHFRKVCLRAGNRILIIQNAIPVPGDQDDGGIVLGQAKVRHDPFQVVGEIVSIENLFRRANLLGRVHTISGGSFTHFTDGLMHFAKEHVKGLR
jgi:hypothetical protein